MEKMPVFCDREEACAVTERIRMSGTYTDGLVSVIIPVYNAEKYLLKTVESVLQQTYREFEIILVNDCSKDGSLKLMEELSKEHPQVKSHTLEHNSGAAVARNYGLKAAQGRYIAFLDSDDTWSPDKLAKQVAMAGEKGAAFVYCAYDMVDAEGMPLGVPSRLWYRRNLISGYRASCSSASQNLDMLSGWRICPSPSYWRYPTCPLWPYRHT